MLAAHRCFLGRPGQRHPQLLPFRIRHLRSHHAYHGKGRFIQRDLLAHNAAIAAKPALPEGVGQHRHVLVAWLVLAGKEGASQHRFHAQDGKEGGRDGGGARVFRFTVAGQVHAFAGKDGHVFENAVLLFPVDIVGHRDGKPGDPGKSLGRRNMPDMHQPSRIAKCHGPQKHRIHHAENRGIRANAQRQHQHGHKGESRALAQNTRTKFQVLDDLIHGNRFSLRFRRSVWMIVTALGRSY